MPNMVTLNFAKLICFVFCCLFLTLILVDCVVVKGQSVVGIVGKRSNLILMVVFCYRIVGSMPTLLYNSDVSVATLVAMMNLEVAKYGKVVGTNKGGGGGSY